MIAVCNLPDTEKAAIEDGIAAALTILMHIVMTNSDALTFTLDPTTDTASAVCVAFTIPHEAWQSAGGAEDDEGGGTYPCRADVVCDEATAMHTPIATLDKACLAAAKACELCPTVETASGVLRFWAMKVPDGELTGSVLLVGQGGGGKSGDGSYPLPTATPFQRMSLWPRHRFTPPFPQALNLEVMRSSPECLVRWPGSWQGPQGRNRRRVQPSCVLPGTRICRGLLSMPAGA